MKTRRVRRRRGCGNFTIEVDQRTDVFANLVILAGDADLQLTNLFERISTSASRQQLAQSFEAKIQSCQDLHVAVMKRSRDLLALPQGLQFAHPYLEVSTLLAEETNHASGYSEVRRSHHIKRFHTLRRQRDEQQVKHHTDESHP